MAADILDLCDAVVAAVTASLSPPGDTEVSREYLTPVKVESVTGRKVYVFPAEYSSDPATRDDDLHERRVALLIVEAYRGAGPVPKEWLDERVGFVQSLWDLLTNARGEPVYGTAWPHSARVMVYDVEELSRHKLFWSELEVTYREVAAP